ncbi:restriction endonuclease subunit S [Cryobacterium glaciale]|uniref:Restriction endonuclease subunit S n=1 Tax=Cryobacterium glaciale TaxID=1259145 RepID=A0A4V3I8Q2_9MICO|nr:restriction endonuclease subunit S [Cryobacterium glaciale]TFB75866.1 restriction endonuclease subunit S [Cryobacterium glaciale]
MTDWEQTTLGEVVLEGGGSFKTGPFGTTLKASEYSSHGVPVISVGEVAYGSLVLRRDTPRVSSEVTTRLAEYVLRKGDIVFGRKGAVDRSAWVQPNQEGWFLGSDGIRARLASSVDSKFVAYQLQGPHIREWLLQHASGSTLLSLNQTTLSRVPLLVPPLRDQQAVAEVLGSLDEKIAANTRIAATSAGLSRALFEDALQKGSVESLLSDVTTLVSRGVTPAYSEDAVGTTMILNQKCVRGQRVSLAPSRRTNDSKVRDDKILLVNDVLVNSTGQGTLGRVARWTRDDRATTDSHISIVRFNATQTNPVAAGYGLLRMQQSIEELGEGSTGQTELSRVDLGNLRVLLPAREHQDKLGARLSELSQSEDAHLAENETLAATRDALLPQLMSGKLRVKNAEKSLAGVL